MKSNIIISAIVSAMLIPSLANAGSVMESELNAGNQSAPTTHVAPAQAPSKPVAQPPLQKQLDALRAQNAILREQLKQANLEKQISQATGDDAGVAPIVSGGASSPAAANPMATTTQPAITQSRTEVQTISGVGNKLTATIKLANGSSLDVTKGMVIPGVGKIASITQDEVLVSANGQSYPLPFAPRQVGYGGMYGQNGRYGNNGNTAPIAPMIQQPMPMNAPPQHMPATTPQPGARF